MSDLSASRRIALRAAVICVVLLAGLLAGRSLISSPAAAQETIHACAAGEDGQIRYVSEPVCEPGETLVPLDNAAEPVTLCAATAEDPLRHETSVESCLEDAVVLTVPSETTETRLCVDNETKSVRYQRPETTCSAETETELTIPASPAPEPTATIEAPTETPVGATETSLPLTETATADSTVDIAPTEAAPTTAVTPGPDFRESGGQSPIARPQRLTTLEDGDSFLITLAGTDGDGDRLSFRIVSGPSKGALGSVFGRSCTGTSVTTCTASVRYKPARNEFGTDSFVFEVSDGTETATATVTIRITPVNDAPTFTKGPNVTTVEDVPVIRRWAMNGVEGPANERTQSLTFVIVSNSNPGLFASGPAVSPSGRLSYTPAADVSGTAIVKLRLHDSGGTANGGDNTSSLYAFRITITPANDEPTFTAGPDVTVAEDSGLYSAQWASDMDPGAPNESSQATRFVVSTEDGALFLVRPYIDPSGVLNFAPASDANGVAVLRVRIRDDGSTTNPGDDYQSSPAYILTVVITPENDAPVAAAGSRTTNEDTPVSIDFAALISDVETADANLTITIVDEPDHGALSNGTYTPDANFAGTDSFTYSVTDRGDPDGCAAAPCDAPLTSTVQTVSITVTPVDDAPFAAGGGAITSEDTTVTVTLVGLDVEGSSLSFAIASGPANGGLDPIGAPSCVVAGGSSTCSATVTYIPDPDFTGTDTFTYTVNDGVNDSAPATFTIQVSPVNDAPVLTLPAAQTVLEDADLVLSGASAISVADVDAGTGAVLVTLSLSSGTIALGGTTGVTVTGNGTSTVTVSGTLAAVNVGLDGTRISLPADSVAAATLTVSVDDNGNTGSGGAQTDSGTVTITVTPVNDAPSFSLPGSPDQSVLEDSGAQTLAAFATGVSAGPADESGQALTFGLTTDNDALFATLPAIDPATGELTYTTAANANGTATVSVVLSDDGGTANGGIDTSAAQTFDITVTAVNDVPSFALPAAPDQSSVVDEPVAPVAGFATSISAGPADESGQTLTFTLTTDNDALFSVLPAIDESTGDLTYTPAPGVLGTATVSVVLSDDGGTANGGDDTSDAQTFVIEVRPPNDAPMATSQTVTTSEDTGIAITLTATDLESDPLTFVIESLPLVGTLYEGTDASGTVLSAGSLPFTLAADDVFFVPAADANGTAYASFTFTANDAQASNLATITIDVTAVNDAPVLANIGDAVTFTEGNPATVVSSTITITDVDSTLLSGGIVSIVSGFQTGDELVFVNQNGITGTYNSGTGVLTLTGSATLTDYQTALRSVSFNNTSDNPSTTARQVQFQVTDSASSASNTLDQTINIVAVNDAPVNTVPGAQSVNEDTNLVFSTGNSNAISVGDVDATTVTVTLTGTNGVITLSGVTGLTFTTGDGTADATMTFSGTVVNLNTALSGLIFRSPSNYNGAASLQILTNDGGQTGSGGALTDTDSVAITVNPVNDAPVAQAKTGANKYNAQANMQIAIPAGSGLLAGATDDDSADTGFTLDLAVGQIESTTVSGASTLVSIAGVGDVTVNADDGTFSFNPAPGVTGDVSFTYTVCDNGNPLPSLCSPATQVTFTIASTVIWFVNPAAATNGDGRLTSPFQALSGVAGAGNDANDVDAANHRIFVYQGSVSGGITLNTSEWLIGQGVTGATDFDTLMGITPPTGTVARPAIGSGFTNPSLNGTVTLASSARVQAVTISTTGAANGLAGTSATTVTVNQTAVTTVNGTAVSLNGVTGTVTLQSVAKNGTGTGVSLTNVGTVTFQGGLALTTGASNAFSATGGGTIAVCAVNPCGTGTAVVNTLTTTTGTALNVDNTTIGGSGLTFRSISTTGAVNGIVLNTTGSSGGLTVTGTGSAGSGGTIQGSTGAGILLTSASSVNLSYINIQNGGDDGIRGAGVNGFTLSNATVSGNGNAVNESGLDFVGGLTGTVTISGSTVSGSAENNLIITNASGALNLSVTGSTFSNTSAATGNDGIIVNANDTAAATVSVTGSTFTNNRGDHFQFSTNATSSGTSSVTFSTNTLTGAAGNLGAGITLSPDANADVTFTVANNNIQGAVANAIAVALGANSTAGGTATGTISGNTIGTAAVVDSGSAQAAGIATYADGDGTLTVAVTNNTVRQYSGFAGIDILNRDGSATINATITGNTVSNPGTFGGNGILITSGAITTDNGTTCAAITGNTLGGSGGGGVTDFRLRQRFLTTIRLPGYAGAAGDTAAVVAFIQGNNTGAETGSATVNFPAGGGGFVGGAACATP